MLMLRECLNVLLPGIKLLTCTDDDDDDDVSLFSLGCRQFNKVNSKVKLLWTGVSSPMFESAIKGRYG